MTVDVSRVAEQAGLLVLTAPAQRDIGGAYVVEATGQRRGDERDGVGHATDLAVLPWDTELTATGQPLELVLARVRHRQSPAAVAVAASPVGAFPPRATLTAASGAGIGLLWTTGASAVDVVAQVRDIVAATGPGTTAAATAAATAAVSAGEAVLELMSGDAGVEALVVRAAAVLAARVTVYDAGRRVVAQADSSPPDVAVAPVDGAAVELGLEHAGAVLGTLALSRAVAFDAGEDRVVAALRTVLALALRAQDADRTHAGPAQAQLALILGDDLQAREAAIRRARRITLFPARRMVVVAVEPFALPVGRPGLARLADQLEPTIRAADRRATVIVFEGGLVLLLDAYTDIEALVRAFRRSGAMPLSIGVSRATGDLRSLPGSYRDAARAATIGRRLGAANQVSRYEELGLLRLLYQLPEHERRAYVGETLGPVAGADTEATEQRRLIRALRATHGNIAEAARLLFVHRNTLRQRVSRLESIIGPFVEDADRRLAVFVALDLHRLDDDAQGEDAR